MERIAKFEKISLSEKNKEYYNDIILPKRATTGSAGYDFYLPYAITINPGETLAIESNIRCKIDDNYVLLIYPRSGLGIKYKLSLDNTVGIIDSDYYNAKNEGHIIISMTNHSDKVLSLKKGESFCQGIFMKYGITIDDDVEDTREGWFGSTGN